MNFQVTVRDSSGRDVEMGALAQYVIENEEYYHITRAIDQRLRQNFSNSQKNPLAGYYAGYRQGE